MVLSSGLLYILATTIIIVIVSGIIFALFKPKTKRTSLQTSETSSQSAPSTNSGTSPTLVFSSQPIGSEKSIPEKTQMKSAPYHPGSIFISHVEDDAIVAYSIAKGLENEGYKAWYHERDSLAGVSYLRQTYNAIESSQAVVVIISHASLHSNQMTAEIVRAHELKKPFIPIMRGININDFRSEGNCEWTEALGAAAAVLIPADGTISILPRIIGGLRQLGVVT